MPAIAVKWAACWLMAWCAARSSSQRLSPLVAPILRRRLDALLHDPQGAVSLSRRWRWSRSFTPFAARGWTPAAAGTVEGAPRPGRGNNGASSFIPAFYRATVTMLSNGKVLIFGGEDAGGSPQPATALFE